MREVPIYNLQTRLYNISKSHRLYWNDWLPLDLLALWKRKCLPFQSAIARITQSLPMHHNLSPPIKIVSENFLCQKPHVPPQNFRLNSQENWFQISTTLKDIFLQQPHLFLFVMISVVKLLLIVYGKPHVDEFTLGFPGKLNGCLVCSKLGLQDTWRKAVKVNPNF